MRYLRTIIKLVKKGIIKTAYSHKNIIRRRYKKFVFHVDCSGLIEFWLAKCYPQAREDVYSFVYQVRDVRKEEIKRLYSFDFYDFFENLRLEKCQTCWQPLDMSEKLKHGDVLAFINNKRKGRFGHVMIVDEELKRTKTKIVVRIIDSTHIEHKEEYRQSEKGGIGCGIIELIPQEGDDVLVCYSDNIKVIRQVSAARIRNLEKNKNI